ncbi:nucleoside-diphosphate-sugar epimerase [Novosphingobium kunmingense]|uniref:Nucleoside-diphosphate-sugar epimerase n=1 Tax=Novosphingobium kunmingense TaxID=1211806 RepID=A0A2N0I3D8_9SPHN|nr:NAD-dependent epimerase/dehydratase family protein [Novosphingobium kunmingense]PKB25696.1 nucleoside-diphosphate-sugar epimerase [Novosphingobium kunmingense]
MAGTVLVSGGSGYIAGETIRQLLARGWTVHTTVRNLSREAELRGQLGGSPETLRFYAADLMKDAGWAEAMDGCDAVCHMASPFPTSVPKDENELIVPAREGALRALRFAHAAGIKRFVMTSSAAAIAYGHPPGKSQYDESDWTNVDAPGVQPYIKSKTIAERAARDWVAANAPEMDYCAVCPVAVIGPVEGSDFAASIDLVLRLLNGSVPALPDVGFSIVDLRDIADLHVRALEADAATIHGERFIGSSGPFQRFADVARVLRDNLGPQARKVPTRKMPNWAVHLLAMVMPPARQLLGELGRVRATSSAHAQEVLGWSPRPPEQSIVDCARSLIEKGVVKV